MRNGASAGSMGRLKGQSFILPSRVSFFFRCDKSIDNEVFALFGYPEGADHQEMRAIGHGRYDQCQALHNFDPTRSSGSYFKLTERIQNTICHLRLPCWGVVGFASRPVNLKEWLCDKTPWGQAMYEPTTVEGLRTTDDPMVHRTSIRLPIDYYAIADGSGIQAMAKHFLYSSFRSQPGMSHSDARDNPQKGSHCRRNETQDPIYPIKTRFHTPWGRSCCPSQTP